MKKSTKSQLLQKLHQAWCNKKHHIWAVIIVSILIFIIAATALAVSEYRETGTAATFTIVGGLCILLMSHNVWRRFFAETGDELIIKISVQKNPNNDNYLAIQIWRAFYTFRLPPIVVIALLLASYIWPEVVVAAFSAIGIALACFSVVVVALILMPLTALSVILPIYEKISKWFKKTQ